jgi:hypothetical protein
MHKLIIIIAAVLSLTACTSTQHGATTGAVAGALIGGLATGTLVGAAIGGVLGATTGAVAGELVGRSRTNPNECVFEDNDGRRYIDVCPNG